MANPKKLPKWAIKAAGGINKKAWRLARAGRKQRKAAKNPRKVARGRKRQAKRITRQRRAVRRVAKKKGNPNRSQKIGAVLKGLRAGDTISAPAQGVLAKGGNPQELIGRYDNKNAVITSASAGATGLLRNVITSKSGAYRGVSQNKILSYVQVLAPEITAAARVNPLADPKQYNDTRHIAHEGYNPDSHTFNLGDGRLRESAVLQAVAWGAQKVAVKLGINKMLPKGVNL